MRYRYAFAALLLVLASCSNELEYDLSGIPDAIVLNAIWSSEDSEHIVYLSKSQAYGIAAIKDTAKMRCIVNGSPVSEADSLWKVTSQDGSVSQCYRIKAQMHPGDSVRLEVSLPGYELSAASYVPEAPTLKVDSLCTAAEKSGIPYRTYDLRCMVQDTPGLQSYYRLFRPSVYVEAWLQRAGILIATRFWPSGPAIDESDPIFKNASFYFPEVLSRDVTFVHNGLSNSTHVFPDDSFADGSHTFSFEMNQHNFISFKDSDYIDDGPEWERKTNYNLLKYTMTFKVSSLNEEEYLYLLAYNAASIARVDPLSEPVSMPSNINGGLGIFAVESSKTFTLPLKDCVYPKGINDEEPL